MTSSTPTVPTDAAQQGTRIGLEGWKVHGAENDFLFFQASIDNENKRSSGSNALATESDHWPRFVKHVCQRRTGVGADGVVIWSQSGPLDSTLTSSPSTPGPHSSQSLPQLYMSIWNADGTQAATCGNALRCLGLLLRMQNLWNGLSPLPVCADPFSVAKLLHGRAHSDSTPEHDPPSPPPPPFATLWRAHLDSSTPTQALVAVEMGWPTRVQRQDSITLLLSETVSAASTQKGMPLCLEAAFQVELANPHIVLIARLSSASSTHVTGADHLEILETLLLENGLHWKRALIDMAGSPVTGDTNLGFLLLNSNDSGPWPLVVHERGAGVTRACGSGATAAAFAAQIHNKPSWCPRSPVPFSCQMAMPGGTLTLSIESRSKDRERSEIAFAAQTEPAIEIPFAVMTGPAVATARVWVEDSID